MGQFFFQYDNSFSVLLLRKINLLHIFNMVNFYHIDIPLENIPYYYQICFFVVVDC